MITVISTIAPHIETPRMAGPQRNRRGKTPCYINTVGEADRRQDAKIRRVSGAMRYTVL